MRKLELFKGGHSLNMEGEGAQFMKTKCKRL